MRPTRVALVGEGPPHSGRDRGKRLAAMADKNLMLTVVVPTKGRSDVLQSCLDHLLDQSLSPNRYEIVVIDDDAGDEAENIVKDFQSRAPCAIRYLRGPGRGVAAARNLGATLARAPLTLFIGNDTIGERAFLSEHVRFHGLYPDDRYAVLGHTKLHPNSRRSPFMATWGDLPYREIEGRI